MQPGDIMTAIGGVPVDDSRASMNQIAGLKPGETVKIDILRNGKPLQLSVAIGERPPEEK
ncbi:PDZ domain-containing protein [Marinobacterium aestuariivivens]|uniref:PDZ domain-containing protein n=1 Tax=Marinobacterium aestuariivivens TaxID=1698799 RepID=A0ABW1ZWD4_9GAMM